MDERSTLPPENRAALPPVVQAYLAFLEREIEQMALLRDQVATLQATVTKLEAKLPEAEARAKQHSGNSSRPPSRDPPSAPARPKRAPTGRKRGGQKGHPRHLRLEVAEEDLAAIIERRPAQYPECAASLPAGLPSEGEPRRVQVWEVPPIRPEVVEHRGIAVRCPRCQELAKPADLPHRAFGSHVTAIGGLHHGRYRLSMRETAGVFEDVLGVSMSASSVPRLCREVGSALDQPYTAAREHVPTQAHANVDETGWKQAGDKRWLWVAVTALCSVFLVAANRSAAVLADLLGEACRGVVTSDRYRAYLSIPLERRQVCWAHLKRNLRAFAERGGPIGEWGHEAVALVDQVFAAWHRFKQGERDRAGLQAEIAPLREKMQTLLAQETVLPSRTAQAFCHDVTKLEPALWTFAMVDGAEPTNNAAERALRPAVLWRKGCFGADSADGNTFVAKILTVAATCRQLRRHLLSYLTHAVIAHRANQPVPALVPTP
jgi:transposase